jgi:hypothetical protein
MSQTMTDEKQALIMLGRIEGQLQAQAQAARDVMTRIASLEDKINARLDDQDGRIRAVELDQARATRHGAWGGTAAGGVIVAAIEIVRQVFKTGS